MSQRATGLAEPREHRWHVAATTVLLLAMALALGACNTMRGLGQDVGAAGETVEDTAEDVQN